MTDCEALLGPALLEAFDDGVSIAGADGECRVTVPFQRADGDAITLWVERDDDAYRISDQGETYGYLYLSNVNLGQDRRKRRLRSVERRFDLDTARHEVALTTGRENLGRRFLDAVQAVQAVSYLAYTRRQYTRTEFTDEVGEFLEAAGYGYDQNVDVDGDSEPHRVDFHVRNGTPTYVDSLHAEDPSTARTIAERTAFKWVDIKARTPETTTIAVLDDESGRYDERTTAILRNYSDWYVPWSARETLRDALG